MVKRQLSEKERHDWFEVEEIRWPPYFTYVSGKYVHKSVIKDLRSSTTVIKKREDTVEALINPTPVPTTHDPWISLIYHRRKTSAPPLIVSVTLLAKSHEKVYGKAYECKMERKTRLYHVTFLGKDLRSDTSDIYHLSDEDCWRMVRTKKCIYNMMDCIGDSCVYDKEPDNNYSWFKDSSVSYAHCYLSTRYLTADDKDDYVLNGKCRASLKFCKLRYSVVVWDSNIIHICPLSIVTTAKFNVFGEYIMSDAIKQAYQVTGITNICGKSFAETTKRSEITDR